MDLLEELLDRGVWPFCWNRWTKWAYITVGTSLLWASPVLEICEPWRFSKEDRILFLAQYAQRHRIPLYIIVYCLEIKVNLMDNKYQRWYKKTKQKKSIINTHNWLKSTKWIIIEYTEVAILTATINLESGGVYADIFAKVLFIFCLWKKKKEQHFKNKLVKRAFSKVRS